MTVKKLKKKLEGMPDDAKIAFYDFVFEQEASWAPTEISEISLEDRATYQNRKGKKKTGKVVVLK